MGYSGLLLHYRICVRRVDACSAPPSPDNPVSLMEGKAGHPGNLMPPRYDDLIGRLSEQESRRSD